MYDDSLDDESVRPEMLKAAFQPHVLLVEDEEQLGRNTEDLLRLDGFQVTRVRDGAAALDRARHGGIDAVILDVMLPDLDGFEVCRQLRASTSSRLIVLMLTALDDTGSKLEGLEGGADDYLVKPVVSRDLCARLWRHLENRSARGQELRRQRLRAIGEIAAGVSREINEPLVNTLEILGFLAASPELPSGVAAELRRCEAELLRIGDVVARLRLVEDKTASLDDRTMVRWRVM